MSEKLDALFAKHIENNERLTKQKEDIDILKAELSRKQDSVIETMRKELKEFSKYIIYDKYHSNNIEFYIKNIRLDFYKFYTYTDPCLIIDFYKDGNIKIKSNVYGSNRPVIYSLNENKWGWYKECKGFITENWLSISKEIEKEIAKHIESSIKFSQKEVNEEYNSILKALDKTNSTYEAISINKNQTNKEQTLLYNAISLLIDETFEQYDDSQKWFDMIQNELGFTAEELEEMGIKITVDGGLEHINPEESKPEHQQDNMYSPDIPLSFIKVDDLENPNPNFTEHFILGMVTADETEFYISEEFGDLIRGNEVSFINEVNGVKTEENYVVGDFAENGLFFVYDDFGHIEKEDLNCLLSENPKYISEEMKKKLENIRIKENKPSLTEQLNAAVNSKQSSLKTNEAKNEDREH